MEDSIVMLSLASTVYCGLRLISLHFNHRGKPETSASVGLVPINRTCCQFCEKPLAWHLRLLGIMHCSSDCKAAERFKLGKAVDGVSGGPLYL